MEARAVSSSLEGCGSCAVWKRISLRIAAVEAVGGSAYTALAMAVTSSLLVSCIRDTSSREMMCALG